MKRRIFLGLAPIFLLILVMGGYAIFLFAKLGIQLDVVLKENYRSVIAGQQMKEASERMDSALSFSLAGEDKRGQQLYADSLPKFEEGLKAELNNITLPGEGELAHSIQSLHQEYSQDAEAFWKTSDPKAQRNLYFHTMLPLFTKIKEAAQSVITINQEHMVNTDQQTRNLSTRSTRYMIFASLLGIGAAILFAARLQHSILQPIQTLTAVSRELGEGKLDQAVPVASKDELGELAEAFNKMAAKLRAYRQVTSDQILQARQMTEMTFSAFPDPIVALTPDGVIHFTNQAALNLFHRIGSFGSLPGEVQEQANAVLQGGPDYLPTSFEKTVVARVDDKDVFLLPRVIGVRNENGSIFGAAVILQDVTKQTELLLAAREDSERLLSMINDLLDLAKLESGKVAHAQRIINSGELARVLNPELEELAESHGCKLSTTIEHDLPDVCVDQRQITQVLTNLISNAAKHSRYGETIALGVRLEHDMVRFSVGDQGPGIPKEFHDRVFDRFFRISGDSSSGAGLGLAIAKEIVMTHGGTIGLHSSPDEGSTFYFDLPANRNQSIT